MNFIATPIEGLFLVQPVVFKDSRGYFFESYNRRFYDEAGLPGNWVQDNQSSSQYGVIRGLHYQKTPYAQSKLVRVLFGSILDVVVDIRKDSPTYQQVYAVELSADNNLQIFVPKGFAHGFSVLSESAVVLYKCDSYYHKPSEAGIRYDDPSLNIDWQIPAGSEIVSEKDLVLPFLNQAAVNF